MKRVICLSLSLIIMICSIVSVDLSAYAVSTESDDFKVVYVNPMLKDYRREILDELSDVEDEALKEEAQSAVSYSSLKFASTYPTQAQAADTLRDAMISRKKSIDIQFVSGTSSVSAIDSVFNEAVDQSNSENAVGGDYLLYHIEAASYRGTRNPVSGKWLFDVTFAVTYLTTALQEERVTYEINQINKRLDLSGKSDYIKALEIHDTVCDYIKYDYDYVFAIDQYGINPIKHSVYGGLFSSLAVCQSYATLYHRLCYENGLKSRVVTSYDHAWNIVNVYGKNYFVDCTFDDGIYDNIDDENGNYWADVYSYIYFLYGSKEVPDTKHILESKYNKSDFKNAYPIEAYGLNGNNCPHEASENDAPENASCAEGFTGDIRCRVCLFWLGNYDVPAGSNHSYINEVVAPTCTSKGYTSHICEYCQYSYTDNSTAKLGHNYKDRITYATLTSKGKVTPVCTVCKVSKSSTTTYPVKTFTLSYTSYTYNGSQKTPAVTVKDSKGKKLVKGTDYKVTYADGRKNIGKYKVTVTLIGKYSGSKSLYFTINPKITLSTTSYTYNGKVKKPTVTVKDKNGKKIGTKYYEVNYAKGLKNVGKYKVTIEFRSGHSGTYTKYFTIKPAKTSISSITPEKKAFTVKWKKKTTQVTGYQVQYSTSSKFSSKTTKTVTKNSTTSKKITGLNANKKYYVRVRTYKTVSGTKYYSDWSAVRTVKTK